MIVGRMEEKTKVGNLAFKDFLFCFLEFRLVQLKVLKTVNTTFECWVEKGITFVSRV